MAQPSGDVIDNCGDSVNAQAGCCLNKLFDSAVGWADFRKPNKSQTNPIFDCLNDTPPLLACFHFLFGWIQRVDATHASKRAAGVS